MPELGSALWLLALPPVALAIWWLHRLEVERPPVQVAALFLWEGAARRSPGGARLSRRADPIWLLRAAIAALVILALAEPAWRTGAGGLVVWFDDSLSMQARTPAGTRQEVAVGRLIDSIEASEHSPIVLRALGDPLAATELQRQTPGWQSRLRAFVAALEPKEADLPLPSELEARFGHWLVTDAAATGIGDWLAAAPIARVINVGGALDNVAITRIAVRPAAADPGRWSGLIEVGNAGNTSQSRALTLVADGRPQQTWQLRLAPGESIQQVFELAAMPDRIVAELDDADPLATGAGSAIAADRNAEPAAAVGDALAADDRLALDLPRLRVAVAVRGACGANLMRALRAHPRAAFGAADPALVVVCGDAPTPGTLPTLRIHAGPRNPPAPGSIAAWSTGSAGLSELLLDTSWLTPIDTSLPDGEPWLFLDGRPVIVHETRGSETLHVLLDLEEPGFGRAPEFPAVIAGLLAALEPALALDPLLMAARPLSASMLHPEPLGSGVAEPAAAASAAVPLQTPLLAGALVLLLLDMALVYRRSRTSRPTGSASASLVLRAVAAIGLVAIVLGPGGRAARDLVVLWDDSASMDATAATETWAALAAVASALPDGSRLSLVRFAADTSIDLNHSAAALRDLGRGIVPEARAQLDASASELAPALRRALRLIDPARPTAVALVSDGHVDAAATTPLLRRAASSGLPVYSLGEAATADVRIAVKAPRRAQAGRPVPIDITLQAPRDMSGQLSLLIDDAVTNAIDLDLAADVPAAIRFELASPPGIRAYQVNWRHGRGALARADVIDVGGPLPWLALSLDPTGPALQSLRAAGWQLESIRPEQLIAFADRLDEFAGIVLDDLAVWDLPTSSWIRIERQITRAGSSLLVLGGPRSFGAGGYRRSTLEDLLPVTAEARDPRATTAVVFALDVSGSMGRSLTEGDPLGYARRAILETAASLGDNDAVGLVAFDVEADVALPLGAHADPVAALESSFTSLGPDGGTRLRPALAAALAELSSTDISRRLLVLVTDGFVEDEELASQLLALETAGIELIALAVGRDADRLALQALVDDGKLFRVERVSELPRLMRSEVEQRRRPMQPGPTPVRRVDRIPADPGIALPAPVAAHMVTMAKPSASVYLETDSGDPLLAAHYAGAGRVAVMPAGLGDWARSWTAASDWTRLGTALGSWLAGDGGSLTRIAVADEGATLAVTVDALDAAGRWHDSTSLPLTVVDPLGRSSDRTLTRTAPGRYTVAIDGRDAGRYLLAVQREPLGARRTHFRSATRERDSVQLPSALPAWLASGALLAAPERAGDWQFSAVGNATPANPWWLALTLAVLLAAIGAPYYESGLALLRKLGRPSQDGTGRASDNVSAGAGS